MDNSGTGFPPGLAIVLGIIACFLYWSPTIMAFSRKVPHKWSVAVVNGLTGWCIVGWIVALAMAARDPK